MIENTAREHLDEALYHVEKAAEKFEDNSREEKIAENAARWVRNAVTSLT